MNKNALIIITLGLIIGIGILFLGGSKTNNLNSPSVENIEIKDGIQYVRVDAGGGYSPRVSSAKAGIPTKLIMKTNGIYDCSASLVIRSIGYQSILPQTGETQIDIGIPVAGKPLQGVCGMGMYNFRVDFN